MIRMIRELPWNYKCDFKKFLLSLVLAWSSFSCSSIVSNDDASNTQKDFPTVNLYIDDENYASLLQQKLLNYYVPAIIEYYGAYRSGIIRPYGSGSRYYPAWSYHILIKEKAPVGSFVLSSQVNDKTMLRSILMVTLCNKVGVRTPDVELVTVTINGEYQHLYLKTDRIDEYYFSNHGESLVELIKAGSSSVFLLNDPRFTLFSFEKQYPDDDNLSAFVEFLDMLSKVSKDSSVWKEFETSYLDVPSYLTFHALMVITNNRDGLANNFLLYRLRARSPYEIITHDFDSAFDVDGDIELTGGNEIIKALSQNEEWKKQYYLIMKEIAEKYFTEELLFPIIDANAPKILQASKTASYFNENLYSYEVDALKNFITRRRALVLSKCNADLAR